MSVAAWFAVAGAVSSHERHEDEKESDEDEVEKEKHEHLPPPEFVALFRVFSK